jgi:hypothetical protein
VRPDSADTKEEDTGCNEESSIDDGEEEEVCTKAKIVEVIPYGCLGDIQDIAHDGLVRNVVTVKGEYDLSIVGEDRSFYSISYNIPFW